MQAELVTVHASAARCVGTLRQLTGADSSPPSLNQPHSPSKPSAQQDRRDAALSSARVSSAGAEAPHGETELPSSGGHPGGQGKGEDLSSGGGASGTLSLVTECESRAHALAVEYSERRAAVVSLSEQCAALDAEVDARNSKMSDLARRLADSEALVATLRVRRSSTTTLE